MNRRSACVCASEEVGVWWLSPVGEWWWRQRRKREKKSNLKMHASIVAVSNVGGATWTASAAMAVWNAIECTAIQWQQQVTDHILCKSPPRACVRTYTLYTVEYITSWRIIWFYCCCYYDFLSPVRWFVVQELLIYFSIFTRHNYNYTYYFDVHCFYSVSNIQKASS